jgi:hypothetical protein
MIAILASRLFDAIRDQFVYHITGIIGWQHGAELACDSRTTSAKLLRTSLPSSRSITSEHPGWSCSSAADPSGKTTCPSA